MAKPLGQINRDLRRKVQSATRHAAAEIMNDLAEAGPNWSGLFRNSWVADAPGQAIGKKGTYPYSITDVASLKDTVAEASKDIKLKLYNTTSYAFIAQDLKEGVFRPRREPRGKIVQEGFRPTNEEGEGIRGDVRPGPGKNRSTAELDWFLNYIDGGGLSKSLAAGVRIGFKRGEP